jgi:hypothetical protein
MMSPLRSELLPAEVPVAACAHDVITRDFAARLALRHCTCKFAPRAFMMCDQDQAHKPLRACLGALVTDIWAHHSGRC